MGESRGQAESPADLDGDRRRDLELVLSAVRAAGDVVMATFGAEPKVWHKSPDQPVTDADLAADALLADRLTGARPGYGWLSEETADRPDRLDRERVWIVDPLDGTRSFVGGYPEFSISVALAELGRAVVAVVYNPSQADLFWAVRGVGAYRLRPWAGGFAVGQRLGRRQPAPAGRPSILASRTEIQRGDLDVFLADWTIRPLGSTAYKLACVAAGMGDAFVSRSPKSEWDVAAGGLILEESGGAVTDVAGRSLRLNQPDPNLDGVVAAWPAMQADLVTVIAGLPSTRLDGEAPPSREEG